MKHEVVFFLLGLGILLMLAAIADALHAIKRKMK